MLRDLGFFSRSGSHVSAGNKIEGHAPPQVQGTRTRARLAPFATRPRTRGHRTAAPMEERAEQGPA